MLMQRCSGSSTQTLAWRTLGDREDQTKKETFHTSKENQKTKTSPDTVAVQFALFPVTCLCHQQESHWGPCWRHLRSLSPFLATAFKVLHWDVRGLDVCLVPYMQSYHYPCLLTIAGPVFVTSAALCLGLRHDYSWSLLFYISLPVSLVLCFALVSSVKRIWVKLWTLMTWRIFGLCDTSAALMCWFSTR